MGFFLKVHGGSGGKGVGCGEGGKEWDMEGEWDVCLQVRETIAPYLLGLIVHLLSIHSSHTHVSS